MRISLIQAVCLAICLAVLPAPAQDQKPTSSDLFQQAYETLTKADEAKTEKRLREASKFYRQALTMYTDLARKYPDLETEVVKFRINYCETQIQAIAKSLDGIMAAEENKIVGATGETNPPPAHTTESQSTNAVEVSALLQKARSTLKTGDADGAMRILLDVIRYEPGNTNARLLVGTAQCMAGRYEDAIKMMTPIIEEQPQNPYPFIILGTADFGLGRLADAAVAMKRAIQLNDTIAEAHYDMVQIILATEPLDTNAARKHYKRAIELGASKDPKLDYLLK